MSGCSRTTASRQQQSFHNGSRIDPSAKIGVSRIPARPEEITASRNIGRPLTLKRAQPLTSDNRVDLRSTLQYAAAAQYAAKSKFIRWRTDGQPQHEMGRAPNLFRHTAHALPLPVPNLSRSRLGVHDSQIVSSPNHQREPQSRVLSPINNLRRKSIDSLRSRRACSILATRIRVPSESCDNGTLRMAERGRFNANG
jgi:hypothetical protein